MAPLIVAARCESFAAVESALAHGADTVELDVHATQEGSLVVRHDFLLPDGALVPHLPLAELRARGVEAPLLVDVLTAYRKRCRFELDLKISTLLHLEGVLNAVRRVGIAPDVEVTSGHVALLPHVRRLHPRLRTGMFFYPFPDWMPPVLWQQHVVDYLTLADAQVAHLHAALLTPAFAARLRAAGFLVHGSNLNTEADLRLGLAAVIDQFSTLDVPLAARLRAL